MTILEDTIKDLAGFKIPKAHFRVGSKIHIHGFYYAKRFFQNSFFASRIAFLLAKTIIETAEKEGRLQDIKNNGLTIIGYEMYSELLISITEKFLRKKWSLDHTKVTHNLYEDFSNLKLCKANNILANVFIIIPIASTFSTSIKIEAQIKKDQLQAKRHSPFIFKPHLNVLFISNGDILDEKPTPIERSFSWTKKDTHFRIIDVEANYNEEGNVERPQKYFLTLPTTWQSVEKCSLCHPVVMVNGEEEEDPLNELPLYETDYTAVTPSIIFDFPRGREISDDDLPPQKYSLDEESISYGHQTRNSYRFLYGINTEIFLERNRRAISDWLGKIKYSKSFKQLYSETDRTIIISTCHFSNVAFITLVNDILFSSSANIIHYDPATDFIQNFSTVYGQELNEANKIFFVDDALKSGTAFEKINQFIWNAKSQKIDSKGISGCFFILDMAQPYAYRNVRSKLLQPEAIYSFANLNLYTSLKSFEVPALQIEAERYKELVVNSFLDSLKAHFQKQADKLVVREAGSVKKVDEQKTRRHLQMLLATHRIYQYFTLKPDPVLNSYSAFLADLLATTRSPQQIKNDKVTDIDISRAFLKVLTQSPFVQFKLLKDVVFKWVLEELLNNIHKVEEAIKDEKFSYELFEELKFFIRRAGLLNSNLLISKIFLNFLLKLYSPLGIPARLVIIKEKKEKPGPFKVKGNLPHKDGTLRFDSSETNEFVLTEQEARLKDFYIFYVAQIKELLLKNESRCLKLEENMQKVDAGTNPFVRQIFRILREENALVIKTFYDHISHQEEWPHLYKQESGSEHLPDAIDYTNDKIKAFLAKRSVCRHPKYQIVDAYLAILEQKLIAENEGFRSYLWIQYFLSFDKEKKSSLNIRTGILIKKLMSLFVDTGVTTSIGAFFLVNDRQQKLFVAFNQDQNGMKEIDDDYLINEDNYIYKFLIGDNNSAKTEPEYRHHKTIIEFSRHNDKWIDLFSTSSIDEIAGIAPNVIPAEYNRLVIVRLSKKLSANATEKAQGILAFYYRHEGDNVYQGVNLSVIRYLLLLRPSISKFIQNHHENDEFTEWRIAEIKQRTSLLTGHGREMLISLAQEQPNEYKTIVATLLEVQRFLIDKREEASITGGRHCRITQMFRGFFPQKDDINESFFDEIKKMAIDIFSSRQIENVEDLYPPCLDIVIPAGFKFDRNLLKMVCFELLVNAKKNRWLFRNKIVDTGEEIYEMNRIWIKAETIELGDLSLSIANTGPIMSHASLQKINQKHSIKKYDNSSGIELIDTLLSEFDLGQLSFSQSPITDELARFSATIRLKKSFHAG